MRRRHRRWFENIDAPTIYSPEQYQQLSTIPGSPDQAEEQLDVSKTEIRELCMRLEAGNEVANDAIHLYRQVIRTNLVNNYLNGSLMGAAVYAVCRKYRVPRTLDDIAEAAHVLVEPADDSSSRNRANDYRVRSLTTRWELQRVYNRIRDRFDHRYPLVESAAFAQWYCDELGLKEQVVEFVEVVIKQMDDETLSGIAPNSIAAGAIYYASEKLDLDLTQRELDSVAQCSVVTIGKTRNLIKESIEP